MTQHVAVLLGGMSAEREVSLTSGAAVAKALEELGYRVSRVDAQKDVVQQLAVLKPDVVFNALHGRWGEDGCVQGALELLGIPYTHSGVLASAVAMDKPMAKKVFTAVGLQVPGGRVFTREEMLADEPMPRPYVIKPSNEGSSVGVMIVKEGDNTGFTPQNWPFGASVLVEPYISGREVQVAVLDDKALGAIEIRPKGQFYDYEAKYTDGGAEHLMPAPIPADHYHEVCELAVRAHQALGCRGLTRSDFRYSDAEKDRQNPFYLLEINTQPGMTPLSLSPEIAAHSGISFSALVDRLVKTARLDNERDYGEKTADCCTAERACTAV
jgi:D-alanine-D-alanine ligase